MGAITLADHIMIADSMVKLYNDGEVRAFLDGKPNDHFFQLCCDFLNSMRNIQEDGSVKIEFSQARLDILKEMDRYYLAKTSLPIEEALEGLNKNRKGHLRLVENESKEP